MTHLRLSVGSPPPLPTHRKQSATSCVSNSAVGKILPIACNQQRDIPSVISGHALIEIDTLIIITRQHNSRLSILHYRLVKLQGARRGVIYGVFAI